MSGAHTDELLTWLRDVLTEYELEPVAVYRASSSPIFPISANDENELQEKLASCGHFLPLPKEPAALANVLEVSLLDFLIKKASASSDIECRRGTERGYPDLEITGSRFGGGYHAVDIKVARRAPVNKRTKIPKTQSRITLYTGNTYFKHYDVPFPGNFRPFQDYSSHLDVIGLYTLNESTLRRIDDLQLIAHEAWRLGSEQRSSTTREYIGAVENISDLVNGKGCFETEDEFYKYWRKFNFETSKAVQNFLIKFYREMQNPENALKSSPSSRRRASRTPK